MFQIIVPVFNEEKVLNTVLENALAHGYLSRLVIANDASTDSTRAILDWWGGEHRLRVIHLEKNANKEGAIRTAMESLERAGNLHPYTVLLDADTRLQVSCDGYSVVEQIEKAISYLNDQNLGAMALRVNAAFFDKPTPTYLSAYATYFGLQFDCWLLGLQDQLWVVNGAGGLFRSEQLFGILRTMVPSFETGDLQITVDLMKKGERLHLYNDIKALTYVPEQFVALFNQRRRWERGTIKVMWKQRDFYLKQFMRPTFLAVAVVLHLALYIGLILTVFGYFSRTLMGTELLRIVILSSLIWFSIDVVKGAWVAVKTEPKRFPLFCIAAAVNGPVWLLVVIPARLYGGIEAICQLVSERRPLPLT